MNALAAAVLLLAQNPDDYRRYADVAEWTCNIFYAHHATWNHTIGNLTTTGEQTERGLIVMRLNQIKTTKTSVEWRGTGSTTASVRLRNKAGRSDETVAGAGTFQDKNNWLALDFLKGTMRAGAGGTPNQTLEGTLTGPSIKGVDVRTQKYQWSPGSDQIVTREPLPLPSPGLILAGGRQGPHHIQLLTSMGFPAKATTNLIAYWSFVPVWRDLDLVVHIEGYDTWLPQGGRDGVAPGNTLTVRAELKSRDGKDVHQEVRKFVFQLLNTSTEPGICLNGPLPDPKAPKLPPFDLRFLPEAKPGSGVVEPDGQSVAVTGEKLRQASAVVSCFDWGAWGELRVTAELKDGRVLVGRLAGEPDLNQILLPKRRPYSHVADAFKADRGLALEEDDSVDEDGAPKAALVKGDGLSLHEEYRGAFLKDGSHARLDPTRMELLVLDADRLLDRELWKSATGTAALPVGEDQQVKQRVNFNSGPDCKPKYALRIEKVKGLIDPEGTATANGIWGQTDASIADQPARSRIFVDRPESGLKHVLHPDIKIAIADPGSEPGKRLYGLGCDLDLLKAADAALSDPAILAEMAERLARLTTIHEVAHACDIDHHKPVDDQGELTCLMRNLSARDKYFRMAQELVLKKKDPVPFGMDRLCESGDACATRLRLRPK